MSNSASTVRSQILSFFGGPQKTDASTGKPLARTASGGKSEKNGERNNSGMGSAIADSRSGNKDFDFDLLS